MRSRDQKTFQRLADTLYAYDKNIRPLPGIKNPAAFTTLIEQILDSTHRVSYIPVLKTRKLSDESSNPKSELFDPVKAAIIHSRKGNVEEAFWLVFLLTHFGRHLQSGWHYVRAIYGRLGDDVLWDWDNISANPTKFRVWLYNNQEMIKPVGVRHGFGNHRKYESIDANSPSGTGAIIESYVNWVGLSHNHQLNINRAYEQSDSDPQKAFDYLYRSMDTIIRFGRTARFDYLTKVGYIGLAYIEPGSPYLRNATGPQRGAKLLFSGSKTARISIAELDARVIELGAELGIGMDVLEDALCNWQKSPEIYKKFLG